MSAGRNKRTPVRVQVFYFEKKQPATPPPEQSPRPPADTVPTMEAVPDPFASFVPAQPPADFEPTVRMDAPPEEVRALREEISRRRTPKVGQPAPPPRGLLKGGAAADAPLQTRGPRRRPQTSQKPHKVDKPRARRPLPAPASPPASPPAPAAPDTEPEVLAADSAEQALEYHRIKLQGLAGREHVAVGLVDQALFGHRLFARGRMREAQVVFEGIVAREPDEAFPYTMLGAVYLAQGDDGRALALFDAALTMDPADPAALVNRAEIRLRRRQPKLALKDLERAIDGARRGPAPFLARARALAAHARAMLR